MPTDLQEEKKTLRLILFHNVSRLSSIAASTKQEEGNVPTYEQCSMIQPQVYTRGYCLYIPHAVLFCCAELYLVNDNSGCSCVCVISISKTGTVS